MFLFRTVDLPFILCRHSQPVLGDTPEPFLFSALACYSNFKWKLQLVDDLRGFRVLH